MNIHSSKALPSSRICEGQHGVITKSGRGLTAYFTTALAGKGNVILLQRRFWIDGGRLHCGGSGDRGEVG